MRDVLGSRRFTGCGWCRLLLRAGGGGLGEPCTGGDGLVWATVDTGEEGLA